MRVRGRVWLMVLGLVLGGASGWWLLNSPQDTAPEERAAAAGAEGNLQTGSGRLNQPWLDPSRLTTGTAGAGGFVVADPTVSGSGANAGTPAPQGGGDAVGRGSGREKAAHQVSNTEASWEDLLRSEQAVLLRNALIDTAAGGEAPIPAHLAAPAETRSYIVQASGSINAEFRARLRESEASIVSYIPNNAYLVRMDPEWVDRLRHLPEVQAVLAYAPYFKVDPRLVSAAVEQTPASDPTWLVVSGFEGEEKPIREALEGMGMAVAAEERSPFGPSYIVKMGIGQSLDTLARLDTVQGIEPYAARELLNDRTRVRAGVSLDSTTNQNYLNLTGSNVWVNVNDTGVDEDHPDLAGRVFGPSVAMQDFSGHGTHVIGTILGNGSRSGTVSETPQGSVADADFRGMAPGAKGFVLPIEFVPEVSAPVTDTYLQETAALTNYVVLGRTNTLISNNSWGYEDSRDYDSAAASYDAAVRDAVPDLMNSQPIAYVFAAGNRGFGQDSGFGGQPSSIQSPATAKNVITVGALESARGLTNFFLTDTNGVVVDEPETNQVVNTNRVFLPLTDSDTQIAGFSGRGNVGIGTEGEFGRFKPDLVAPGTFIISARSQDWELENDVDPESPFFDVLDELNQPLGPHYRYASGTCMAAATVSGVLALVQEFFSERLPEEKRRALSPALMKALLINRARAAGPFYDLQVQSAINYQGWGSVNLTNVLPRLLALEEEDAWPVWLMDQNPTNALATGQARSWDVKLSDLGAEFPLRISLVWTDPAGNPNGAIKLVNDLDLVVSNTVTHEVYYGNNIAVGSSFNEVSSSNAPPVLDRINNVENVFIREPGDTNFVVTVIGRRVNVHAVPEYHELTGRTNDIVQDFALVISTDNGILTNAVKVTEAGFDPDVVSRTPTAIRNGIPLLNERVGANAPLLASDRGLTNQWNFYVFTNRFDTNGFATLTNGTNVAFVTFLPPNLSTPRELEADIDLYVSQDARLLDLHPAAVANALTSRTRNGSETVVLTNAVIGDVFYVGVKAEDQMAADYGLITLSTDDPFDEDDNGARIIRGFPLDAEIPDGTANNPGGVRVIGVGVRPIQIQRVIVTNTITHENIGDLVGTLTHNNKSVVLNNHTLNSGFFRGTFTFVYDDSDSAQHSASSDRTFVQKPTDGPGSLDEFVGEMSTGAWILNMVDNAPAHTGQVDRLVIRLEPLRGGDLTDFLDTGITNVILPGELLCFTLDVPLEATNMILRVAGNPPPLLGELDLMVRRGAMPSTNNFDKQARIPGAGGMLTLNAFEEPNRLRSGQYFVCLHNPNPFPVAGVPFRLIPQFELDLNLRSLLTITSTNRLPLLDNAVTRSIFRVFDDREVAEVRVGLRIDHPRVSDLRLKLISPEGTGVLLSENRGGQSTNGFGAGYGTNISHVFFTEKTNLTTGPIKFAQPPFADLGRSLTNLFETGFEGVTNTVVLPGELVDGWGAVSNQVRVLTDSALAHRGTNFLALGDGGIERVLPTVAGREYELRVAYRTTVPNDLFSTGVDDNGRRLFQRFGAGVLDPHYQLIESADPAFPGPHLFTTSPSSFVPGKNLLSTNSLWLALAPVPVASVPPMASVPPSTAAGAYTIRTQFDLSGMDPASARITGQWTAAPNGVDVLLNGTALGAAVPPGPDTFAPLDIGSGFVAGVNRLDFVVVSGADAPVGLRTELELTATALPGEAVPQNQGFLVVDGFATNRFLAGTSWKTNVLTFVAPSNNMTARFFAEGSSLLLDSIELAETGNLFYLPEESLRLMKGERALGDWTLEIADTRSGNESVGGTDFPAELVEWQLDVRFAEALPPTIQLTNAVSFTGTVETNQTNYFEIQTCPDTTAAFVILSGLHDTVTLLADWDGLPTGLNDDYEPIFNTSGGNPGETAFALLPLTTNSPAAAPLLPGRRLFLAVHNVFADETNDFTLQVVLDRADCSGQQVTPVLQSNSTVSGQVPPSSINTFVFNPSSQSADVEFELEPGSGDLALAVHRGAVAVDLGTADYASDEAGLETERIRVRPETEPALVEGDWYVTVINRSNVPGSYRLSVVEQVTAEIGLEQPTIGANGELVLNWSSVPGRRYIIETSVDLVEWKPIGAITATDESIQFEVAGPASTSPHRFYRVRVEE